VLVLLHPKLERDQSKLWIKKQRRSERGTKQKVMGRRPFWLSITENVIGGNGKSMASDDYNRKQGKSMSSEKVRGATGSRALEVGRHIKWEISQLLPSILQLRNAFYDSIHSNESKCHAKFPIGV
jgi:hypothetical protein